MENKAKVQERLITIAGEFAETAARKAEKGLASAAGWQSLADAISEVVVPAWDSERDDLTEMFNDARSVAAWAGQVLAKAGRFEVARNVKAQLEAKF